MLYSRSVQTRHHRHARRFGEPVKEQLRRRSEFGRNGLLEDGIERADIFMTINMRLGLSNLKLKTERYSLNNAHFSYLGNLRRQKIRDAMLYVRDSFSVVDGQMVVCKVVRGERSIGVKGKKAKCKDSICFCCDTTAKLTTHHIVPVSRGGTKVHEKRIQSTIQQNLVRLCVSCHTQLEVVLKTMEMDRSKPTCYMDYVGALVVFALTKITENNFGDPT